MPDIMTRFNKVFDDVSDNITIIKGKFMEFAAGLLSKLAPALEFITTAMTRFDAAALGMRLGEIITGAGNGIAAFSDALKSISLGDFEGAWKIAFTAIKLTAAESINSIYANIKGLFAAIGTMLEQSGLVATLDALVSGIANKITSALRSAIADFIDAIGVDPWAAKEMRLFSEADATRAENYFQMVKAGFASLGENAAAALDPMSEAYDKARDSAGQLIKTSDMQAQLEKERAALQEKITASIREQGIEAEKYDFKRITLQEQYQKTLNVIADLEEQIKEAKMLGDDNKVKQLERQLALEKLIAEEIKNGKTYQEALAIATEKQNNADANILANKKDQTKEMKEQLSLSQQMQEDLDKRAAEEQADPGGRTKSKFDQAMEAGDFTKAQRETNKMLDQENKAAAKSLFADLKKQQKFDKQMEGFGADKEDAQREADKERARAMKMSPVDMAKELGLETSGKKRSELNEAIKEELEKRKEQDKPGKEGEKQPAQEQKKDPSTGVLQSILTEVKGIGNKLPITALGT